MSAFAVRKNNLGRALVRFLIGAIILAALVIVLWQVVLKEPKPTQDQTADGTTQGENYEPAGDGTKLLSDAGDDENKDDTAQTQTGDGTSTDQTAFVPDGLEPDGTDNTGDNTGDETDDDFGAVVVTPTPVPTPDPTPTPEPRPTAMPRENYSQRITSGDPVKSKWLTDKQSRINNGITTAETAPSENGGDVISLVGWSFATYYSDGHGWNGKDNTTYVTVTNEKGDMAFYPVKVVEGISGVKHETRGGKNMDKADFTCVIDVSTWPDGTYSLGTANYFTYSHNGKTNKFHHGYTLGSAYEFIVKDGVVTNFGGIENN